jgi:hypothetical protein
LLIYEALNKITIIKNTPKAVVIRISGFGVSWLNEAILFLRDDMVLPDILLKHHCKKWSFLPIVFPGQLSHLCIVFKRKYNLYRKIYL